MPLSALNTITVVGRYFKADGTPATGQVSFTLKAPRTNLAPDNLGRRHVVLPLEVRAPLTDGAFSVELALSSDADYTPPTAYTVREQVQGYTRQPFDIVLDETSPTPFDLIAAAPAVPPPANPEDVYLTTALADAKYALKGEGGGGGYSPPAGGIPETDLASDVQTKLNAPAVDQTARDAATAAQSTADAKVSTTDPRLSDARTPTAHTHTASQVSDSTTTGRAVLTASSAANARTAIGAGTASTKADVGLGSVDNVPAANLRDRSTHTGAQAISTVTGLQSALDGKQPTIPVVTTQAEADALPVGTIFVYNPA